MGILKTETINDICEKVINISEAEIVDIIEMYQGQLNYVNPLDFNKQRKFNKLGEFNKKAVDLIKQLKEHLKKQ